MFKDRSISPRQRSRCVLIRQSRSLHQHPYSYAGGQAEQAHIWALLVSLIGDISVAYLIREYSCYNAFSRVDMRVQVQIPGTVESYCVDERNNKMEATEEHWLETYLCSVLRAYSYADNGSGDSIKRIIGVRRFNPITNTEQEHKFLDAAEKLFFSGT
jgi:hypothetical protein